MNDTSGAPELFKYTPSRRFENRKVIYLHFTDVQKNCKATTIT